MSDLAIRVEGLSKRYRRGTPAGHDRLTEVASNVGRAVLAVPGRWLARARPEQISQPCPPKAALPDEFWALRDVSFEVCRGEAVGIIGRNGAGKSTLLRILSRITEPTTGRFGVRGRVGSLLEVGTGFHPELTGRENVYLNGTLLGMTRREIIRKFDAIAAFAEVNEFLDTPVKRYSSGMQVRLGFAVAAHLGPDILIVDEALAVGDAAFQKKCVGKMREVATSGRTVLFVSHHPTTVLGLCSTALWIDHGRVEAAGPVEGVLERYLRAMAGPCAELTAGDAAGGVDVGGIQLVRVDVRPEPVYADRAVVLELTFRAVHDLPDLRLALQVLTDSDEIVFTSAVRPPYPGADGPRVRTWRARCHIPGHVFNVRGYRVRARAHRNGEVGPDYRDVLRFVVRPASERNGAEHDYQPGVVAPAVHWEVAEVPAGPAAV